MPPLAERLKRQLAAKGEKGEKGEKGAEGMAYGILNKRGDMKGSKLTAKGEARQHLGAAGRAKDRAAKANGGKPSDYAYDKKTNHARRK